MKSKSNWPYGTDYSDQNWTGKIPRQSRITGYWSEQKREDRIPLSGYIIGVCAVAVLFLSSYI